MESTNNNVVVASEVNKIVDLTATVISQKNSEVNSAKDRLIGSLESKVESLESQVSENKNERIIRVTDYYGHPSFLDVADLQMIVEHKAKVTAEADVEDELTRLKKFKAKAELDIDVLRAENQRKREIDAENHKRELLAKDSEINLKKNEIKILTDNIEYKLHTLQDTFRTELDAKEKQVSKLQDQLNDKSEVNKKQRELDELKASIEKQQSEIAELNTKLTSKSIGARLRRLFSSFTGTPASFGRIISKGTGRIYDPKKDQYVDTIFVHYAI